MDWVLPVLLGLSFVFVPICMYFLSSLIQRKGHSSNEKKKDEFEGHRIEEEIQKIHQRRMEGDLNEGDVLELYRIRDELIDKITSDKRIVKEMEDVLKQMLDDVSTSTGLRTQRKENSISLKSLIVSQRGLIGEFKRDMAQKEETLRELTKGFEKYGAIDT